MRNIWDKTEGIGTYYEVNHILRMGKKTYL